MTLAERITLHIDERFARIADAHARRIGVLRQDLYDDLARSIVADGEAATLARLGSEAAAALTALGHSIPASGWPAHVVRQYVEVHRFVGEADRLVRQSEGWTWQRVSQGAEVRS